jgi:hypothetical protein
VKGWVTHPVTLKPNFNNSFISDSCASFKSFAALILVGFLGRTFVAAALVILMLPVRACHSFA